MVSLGVEEVLRWESIVAVAGKMGRSFRLAVAKTDECDKNLQVPFCPFTVRLESLKTNMWLRIVPQESRKCASRVQ